MLTRKSAVEQTKQTLTDAFWRLYREKGIDKITVREITTLAGYNRSTFYEYFYDVYDVLKQLEDSLLEKLRFGAPKIGVVSIAELAATFEENAEYLSVLFSKKGDISFMFGAREKLKKPFYDKAAELGKHLTFEEELELEYHVAGIVSSMIYWLHLPDRPSAEKYLENLHAINDDAIQDMILKFSSDGTL